ncbi:MAG TPA: hypothetical protein DIC52_14800 [Candidatus Latescibacteria bacterium]|jgi:hypothetical protein|nr:hypothetical protein [Candidatus Latescibacterota bacterium]|tara:strand:- start:401 stop:652 length:252 start_codon:yes stop_codon:yes gene_type:complete
MDKIDSMTIPDIICPDTYLGGMDRPDEADPPPRRANRDELRQSIRHPYITRQHPAGPPAGDAAADADSAPSPTPEKEPRKEDL